jgi:hypothetical protein
MAVSGKIDAGSAGLGGVSSGMRLFGRKYSVNLVDIQCLICINMGFKTIMLDCGSSMANGGGSKVCKIAKIERE